MATRAGRLAEFTTDQEPRAAADIELLCEDHNGTYVLPFPCHRRGGAWFNSKTGEAVAGAVVGWRSWYVSHGTRPRTAANDR
jgi:hypothetical protein